jgi:ABC-type multidrug transport system ATPase subunit/predicted component of type VI protein secretion system
MSQPGALQITVRHEGTDRVFEPSQQITMGRAPEVTLFVDSPLVSRVHATLAWQGSSWVLTDNGSTNGVFVDARRLTRPVAIDRPTQVRLGDAISGPLLHLLPQAARPAPQRPAPNQAQTPNRGQTPPPGFPRTPAARNRSQTPPHYPLGSQTPPGFPNGPARGRAQTPPGVPQTPAAGRHPASAAQRPAQQGPAPAPNQQRPAASPSPQHEVAPPTQQRPPVPKATDAPNINMTTKADTSALPPLRTRASTAPFARADRIPDAGLTIGRTSDNQIVVNDPLASRKHARLVKGGEGLVIEDLGSANGTFVNGRREQRAALRERDIVTIGNLDFVVQDGTLALRTKPAAEQGLDVHGVAFSVDGKQLLVDVNMQAGSGTLTALIGPSGAGKSTLSRLIAGTTHPSAGVVTFEGRNLHAEYEAMRSRIGMVPQDDVLHRQLTVRQALNYAAQLRLPADTSKADRRTVIDDVLDELSLAEHADTRVDRLSGGQRKRASVALELLTGPSLLILDEPTSGLDPALDRQVMSMLRELADAGRTVIVVTHSVACLDMCDQVLLLAPGGKTAFCGHPGQVGQFLGTSDWAEIFSRVAADPDRAFANYRSRQAAAPPPPPATPRGETGKPPKSSSWKQFSTLSRRQARLILADRGYLAFLVLLPFLLGALALVVQGNNGLAMGPLEQKTDNSGAVAFIPSGGSETQSLLVVLVLSACLMGSTLTVRDLVGERPIYYRERAVGLRSGAYLVSKIMVFGCAALLQSAVLVAIVIAGKKPPGKGVLIPQGGIELYVDIALTAISCVIVGLALSTIAKSTEQVFPLLVLVIMCQLVMAGGMISVTNRVVLEQVAWLFPARWGFAAGASSVNLQVLNPLNQKAVDETLWQHTVGIWALDVGMLGVLGLVLAILTWWRLRLKKSTA